MVDPVVSELLENNKGTEERERESQGRIDIERQKKKKKETNKTQIERQEEAIKKEKSQGDQCVKGCNYIAGNMLNTVQQGWSILELIVYFHSRIETLSYFLHTHKHTHTNRHTNTHTHVSIHRLLSTIYTVPFRRNVLA